MKRAFLWFVSHTVNRITGPMVRAGRGPWALLRHVGRRSGRVYETPLLLARTADGFVAELTYGTGVDWYRNIVAAGRCVVVRRGVEYRVDRIEPCPTAEGLAAFALPQRTVLRLARRHEFRRLHVAAEHSAA